MQKYKTKISQDFHTIWAGPCPGDALLILDQLITTFYLHFFAC